MRQCSALALGPCLLGFTGLAVPAIENSRLLSSRWLQPCSSEPLPSLCLPGTTEGSQTGIAGPPDLCSTTRGWYPGARAINVVIQLNVFPELDGCLTARAVAHGGGARSRLGWEQALSPRESPSMSAAKGVKRPRVKGANRITALFTP